MKKFIPFLFLFIYYSCDINQSLSKNDLKWIDVYRDVDQLVFESENKVLDTIQIKEIKIWTENRDTFASSYNPECGKVITDKGYIIEICKMSPGEIRIILNFKGDFLPISKNDTAIKKEIKFQDNIIQVYEIQYAPYNRTIDKVYWNEKLGIVKYVEKNKVKWNLIN